MYKENSQNGCHHKFSNLLNLISLTQKRMIIDDFCLKMFTLTRLKYFK